MSPILDCPEPYANPPEPRRDVTGFDEWSHEKRREMIREATEALNSVSFADTPQTRLEAVLAIVKRYRDQRREVAEMDRTHSAPAISEQAKAVQALYEDCLYAAGEDEE